MSGDGDKRMWTKDTIAGAVLGCVACVFVQSQLQTLADRLNSPLLEAGLRWWPTILVVAGLVLLVTRKPRLHTATGVTPGSQEVGNERRQSRNG